MATITLDSSAVPEFKTKVELRHFPIGGTMVLSKDPALGELKVYVELEVPDRETGKPTTIIRSIYALNAEESDILVMIYGELRGALLHELDEAWHVDDVRVKDPHDPCTG